jgi:hypothetical protein
MCVCVRERERERESMRVISLDGTERLDDKRRDDGRIFISLIFCAVYFDDTRGQLG